MKNSCLWLRLAGGTPKPQCIAVNGRFLFSVHTGKDNNMAAAIVMDNTGKRAIQDRNFHPPHQFGHI
jgi:hypothetical protein